jgi:hypothetical protein
MSNAPLPTGPKKGITFQQSVALGILIVGVAYCSSRPDDNSGSTYYSDTKQSDARKTLQGATLNPAEQQNYERDPSSMGFSDEDRAFLKEHGVSEKEARAIEEVTRKKGVE